MNNSNHHSPESLSDLEPGGAGGNNLTMAQPRCSGTRTVNSCCLQEAWAGAAAFDPGCSISQATFRFSPCTLQIFRVTIVLVPPNTMGATHPSVTWNRLALAAPPATATQ